MRRSSRVFPQEFVEPYFLTGEQTGIGKGTMDKSLIFCGRIEERGLKSNAACPPVAISS
jgi:hypothetical protein